MQVLSPGFHIANVRNFRKHNASNQGAKVIRMASLWMEWEGKEIKKKEKVQRKLQTTKQKHLGAVNQEDIYQTKWDIDKTCKHTKKALFLQHTYVSSACRHIPDLLHARQRRGWKWSLDREPCGRCCRSWFWLCTRTGRDIHQESGDCSEKASHLEINTAGNSTIFPCI